MIKLNAVQIDKINKATLRRYPHEMCGVLTADDFIEVDNIHSKPESSFTMHRLQYGRLVNSACAIVHSHVKRPEQQLNIDIRTPSVKDKRFQKLSGLPWLIVGTEGFSVTPALQFPRVPNNQYVGRDFIWSINDCYTLVQDFYHFERGIELLDQDVNFDPVNQDVSNVFDSYVEQYGFMDILLLEDIKDGDLLLLDALGFKNNHLAIYFDKQILHQLQTSKIEPFANYKNTINRILRYVG